MSEDIQVVEAGERARSGGSPWLRYAPLGLAAVGAAVVLASGAGRYLSLEALREQRLLLLALVAAHPFLSLFGYMGLYVAVVAFSLPGALVMTLSGGFLFGVWLGSAAAVAGASTGAVIMFLVARSALGDVLRARTKSNGMTRRIEDGVRKNAFSCILTLRLIPAIPFWLVNVAAGFVKMPLSTYWWATVLGIAPATAIYAGVGAGLSKVFDHGGKADVRMLLQPQMFLPLIGLAALSILPIAYQLWRRRREGDVADAAA